jgi:hypothetical protein
MLPSGMTPHDLRAPTKRGKSIALLAGLTAIIVIVLVLLRGLPFLDPFQPGPGRGVAADKWSKLRIGMTKDEVTVLLDVAESETSSPFTGDFWQYGWSDGVAFRPADRAHVVFFDSRGRVSRLRTPLRQDTDPR